MNVSHGALFYMKSIFSNIFFTLLSLNPIFGFQVTPGLFRFEYFANFCHFKVFNRTLEQLSCKKRLIFIFLDNYLVVEDFQDWSGMFF